MHRRIISCLVAILVAVGAMSVAAQSQFRYGPMAEIDFTNLRFKQDLAKVDMSMGYGAGIACEFMFPGIGFGIDFGINYEQRGATLDLGQYEMWKSQGFGRDRIYLHYAVIPIHLRFKYTNLSGLEDKIAPLAYAGPSVGLLVGHGNVNCMSYAAGELGIDFGIGAELWHNWQVSGCYTMGVTYALKDKTLTNYSARNSTWSVKVAYFF